MWNPLKEEAHLNWWELWILTGNLTKIKGPAGDKSARFGFITGLRAL
jgi:hypothetical protein